VSYFSQAKQPARDKANDKVQVNGTGADAKAGGRPLMATNTTDIVSTLGAGMLITGNIVCEGSAQIFGRVVGDIQAMQVLIGEGAHVEGNIAAQEVTINGAFKGTIRAHNVRLKGSATVDGEIFSKSLTVEENVQFEGVSRRLEKSVELPSSAQANGAGPLSPGAANSGAFAQSVA
jgi:cytoskeletal protein CcmA (bactofilin family)